ncbi:hypothetical protein GXP67_10710 [Rhodocytophaga rosea]|uniref:Uncharacterized protein n=1 Tax=Rhodocytophaga rosea TaxID=2704465 RepID=A0A6C0GGT1_9BACT|nr:hypothetical protein [Rhodocytophaga rosea]QHT67085.1 hypothetical protein GXP67_10710 [Rhodocytophaga rosea]
MNIESNSLMNSYLECTKYKFESINIELPEEFEKGFRSEQGCILLKDFHYFGAIELDTDYKKCEYEVFLNDIHVDDYFKCIESELEYLLIGLTIAKRLHKELNTDFEGNFRIIISFNETIYSGEDIDTYGGCVVKFHKIRPSTDEKFKFSDLEDFKSEAVMIIE